MKSKVRGFTMVELMVGLTIGMITILAMVTVMITSEEQKRATTSGMDAQVNGSLALASMMREIEMAGYGFSSFPPFIGCKLQNQYGKDPAGNTSLPDKLVPVVISEGVKGAPDAIRAMSSNKGSFSIPLNLIAPDYKPGDQFFTVQSIRGVKGPGKDESGNIVGMGDLMVVAHSDTSKPCQVFEVTGTPEGSQIPRADNDKWNNSGFPNETYAVAGNSGPVLVNLGNVRDIAYSISTSGDLVATRMVLASDSSVTYSTSTLFNNIVQLAALYGKDTNGDGSVDTWDKITPKVEDNAAWLQIIAVRVALVSRSTNREKLPVTFDNPEWNVGTADTVAGTKTCASGSGKCLTLDVKGLTDWNYYRYKVFDTVIPLRNMLWKS